LEARAALALILNGIQLKRVPRTGWAMRGVPDVESVADHSFGVAFVALVLKELVDQPIDGAKLLAIALVHDLAESNIGDIPTPALAHFAPGAKRQAELAVLNELLVKLPDADRWIKWWHEFEDGTSVEGRLVRDADRLDMLLQAHAYEQSTGNRSLEEFWQSSGSTPFEFTASQALFEALKALR
jgi:putative hydrolase of HD superfamily